jgi:hypothetical protein
MEAAITVLLALLAQIAPGIGASSTLTQIIAALIQLLPVLIQEFQAVVPMVKNIIAALSSNANITPEQLAQLADLDKQCDDAFEAAAAAAAAEDTPPPVPPAPTPTP